MSDTLKCNCDIWASRLYPPDAMIKDGILSLIKKKTVDPDIELANLECLICESEWEHTKDTSFYPPEEKYVKLSQPATLSWRKKYFLNQLLEGVPISTCNNRTMKWGDHLYDVGRHSLSYNKTTVSTSVSFGICKIFGSITLPLEVHQGEAEGMVFRQIGCILKDYSHAKNFFAQLTEVLGPSDSVKDENQHFNAEWSFHHILAVIETVTFQNNLEYNFRIYTTNY